MAYKMVRLLKKQQKEMGNIKTQVYVDGVNHGRIQGKLEVAERLFLMRMGIEKIAECTELHPETLQNLYNLSLYEESEANAKNQTGK